MSIEINKLALEVASAAAEIERTRALPTELVRGLHAAGAFRALIPQRFGGGEVPLETYVAEVEALAQADASVAWCVNQAAVIGLTSLWLPEETIRQIWASPNTAVANGPPMDCLITPTEAGYSLTGRWGFSSGCQHATWMMAPARCSEGGYRIAYFDPELATFHDTWQVAGLRGTGSFEFSVQNLNVPADFVGDLSAAPTHLFDLTLVPNGLLFAVTFAAVAVGTASGAVKDVVDIAQGKTPKFSHTALRDDADTQRFLGKATARLQAARAYLHMTVAEVMAWVRTEGLQVGHMDDANRARLRLAGTHVIRECAEVVDLAYKMAGSTGIYHGQILQRRFQDMHVITQHAQARETFYGAIGRYTLSGEYDKGPLF